MAAAVLAAAFLFAALPLPSQSLALPPDSSGPTARGAFHIHTNRSDGSGSPDAVAAAAARAGLNFIIVTDHGDGTRKPDAPQYRAGVLVIDAVELSTEAGHYIAIGLAQAPYPLRGEARDVIADVRRLGGFGVVAHPDSSKPSLRWRDWDADFDAMEWLNADTEWRDERRGLLVRAFVHYPFRPSETLASLLDRPDATLARWDALTERRPVVALAGADAHARAGWMDDDANGYRGWFLKIPSYEASFRTFAMRVTLDRPLGTDATSDARLVIDALRRGAVYTTVDAIASPATLEFSADSRTLTARTNATSGGTHRSAQGRPHHGAATIACAHDPSTGGGHIPGRGVFGRGAGKSADSVDCEQPYLSAIGRMGIAVTSGPATSDGYARYAGGSMAHREGRWLDCSGQAG